MKINGILTSPKTQALPRTIKILELLKYWYKTLCWWYITMVLQESKELIVEYIKKRNGQANKNDVARYMEDEVKKEEYRTSRMTTYGILKELEEAKRIRAVKSARKGQSHKLIYNDRNDYDQIAEQITNIGTMLREHPEAQDRMLNLAIINLARTHKYIKNENDKQSLTKRIIDLLLKIRYKKEDLLSII